jgi:hypothetical protein
MATGVSMMAASTAITFMDTDFFITLATRFDFLKTGLMCGYCLF